MTQNFKIAALLTCFNRKAKTQACLTSLFKIVPNCQVFLVNDGSTDGTAEMISEEFPNVCIIEGTGDLFWSRGMYTAWTEAVKGEYDYYLWLNDDIELYPFFLDELLECIKQKGQESIVSGVIESMDKEKILYGGSDSNKKLILPNGVPQPITFMNGNVVLVPKEVVEKIGIIDPILHHDLGDVDYGLTAIKNGISVYATRKAIAGGYANHYCRVRKWNSTIGKRFKRLYSPLGSDPRINFYFRKKHFGVVNAALFYVYIHTINILPDLLINKLFGDSYKDK